MEIRATQVYLKWLNALRDPIVRGRVLMRVDRMVHGNQGVHRHIARGVCELKIDAGPGYRVYYLRRGRAVIILLAGGDKSTQRSDIEQALALADNLLEQER